MNVKNGESKAYECMIDFDLQHIGVESWQVNNSNFFLLLEKSKLFWKVRSLKMWKVAGFMRDISDEVFPWVKADIKGIVIILDLYLHFIH